MLGDHRLITTMTQ